MSLNGSDTTAGGGIIMPIDISTAAVGNALQIFFSGHEHGRRRAPARGSAR
jgi:hypothetical protein